MSNLTTLNITLNKMSANKALVDSTRASIVNEIIALIIDESKDHGTFANKRIAQKWIITQLLDDENKNLDNYTKRAIKVAKAVLVDGYKIKKELLTIAQAENLVREDKKIVNAVMKKDEEAYTDACKDVIKAYNTQKAVNELNKADAIVDLNVLIDKFGDDTRKVLNNMIKAL